MKEVPATKVRAQLMKFLGEVADTGEDLGIIQNGKRVAILTRNPPTRRVPPLEVPVEKTRKKWASALSTVIVRNARFCFEIQGKHHDAVYLIRDQTYRNEYSEIWLEHIQSHKPDQEPISRDDLDSLEDRLMSKIGTELESHMPAFVQQIVKTSFAYLNRNGDLFKTPEHGTDRRTDADDLDRY